MAGSAFVDTDPVESRLSRLARMPADTDAAIRRLSFQIDAARVALGTDGEALIRDALDATASLVPCLPAASDVAATIRALEALLQQHHPEEIRVASFAFWCRVAAQVRRDRGAVAVEALLDALESTA